MASGNGDAAMKDQASVCVVNHRIAGRRRTKPSGFCAVSVDLHRHTRNGGCLVPKGSFCPGCGQLCRSEEDDVGANPSLRARHKSFQLAETGRSAGTMGMSKHNQGEVGWWKRNCA